MAKKAVKKTTKKAAAKPVKPTIPKMKPVAVVGECICHDFKDKFEFMKVDGVVKLAFRCKRCKKMIEIDYTI